MMGSQIKYVAIGDSFTEGVGDTASNTLLGWADRTAQAIADARGEPILYANLAIRGRLLQAIIDEQLDAALALKPTLVSFNGGGNDMLRPGTNISWITEVTRNAMQRIIDAQAEPLLLTGANPTAGIPGGKKVQKKGDLLVEKVTQTATDLGIKLVDNWGDHVLASRQYWSADRLHLSSIGHTRVARNVLNTLEIPTPNDWAIYAHPVPKPGVREELKFIYSHVAPWIGRRLTGRSSGDGRTPKYAEWVEIHPRT